MNNTVYHRSPFENVAPSFRDIFIMREEAVKQLLAIYVKNLNRLEIREAKCGLHVPTDLLNEIEDTREKICHLTREVQRKEGILPVLEALSQRESIDRRASNPVRSGRSLGQVLD